MPSLKRHEAVARAKLLNIGGYEVFLDLTHGDEFFHSLTTIRFSADVGASTFVEVSPKQLISVNLNGVELPLSDLENDRYPIENLSNENVLVIEADMKYSHSGEGLHRFTDPEDGQPYTYMMGFLDMASRVFACFEQPDLKAPYQLTVKAPKEWTVIANEGGDQVEPGLWRFKETKPLATYFVSVVAGPYHSLYREHDGVTFGLHARQTYREALETDAEELFDVTFGTWDRFHELYGVRYPFGGTYDQCFVPEFNAGAMENPGCVTFRDEAFMYRSAVTRSHRERRAVTMAHEMAHMWFGDLVTMTWWDDLWLNESFANCMGERGAAEGTVYRDVAALAPLTTLRGIRADQRPSTHPVSGNVAESGDALANFDGISYAKGGAILNQLAAWLGDEVFFTGLREYFDTHRYGNASLSDLIDALAKASGKDLASWAQQWLQTTGPNTLRLAFDVVDGTYRNSVIEQSASADHPTLRPHYLRLGLYRFTSDGIQRTESVPVEVTGARTVVSALDGVPVADLVIVNDGNLTYAKTRLDELSLASVPRALQELDDSQARSALWCVLTDMVDDGELAISQYLDILAESLPSESQIALVESNLNFARSRVADEYCASEARAACLRQISDTAVAVGERAAAGDGAKLTALRTWISCALTDEDIAGLRMLLASEETSNGIVMDDDLKWATLLRLCVLGSATEQEIADQLIADASSEGHKQAATCRAALPTPEAKKAAWDAVMSDEAMSNHVLVATAAGFWWPEQKDLTVAYTAKFFEDAPVKLAARMPWEIMHLARLLFPRHDVRPQTVELARSMLAIEGLDSLLYRTATDSLDDLERAVRVRSN